MLFFAQHYFRQNPLENQPCQFQWSFLQILEYITYSCKITWKFIPSSPRGGPWRREQTTELMQFLSVEQSTVSSEVKLLPLDDYF